MNTLVEKFNKGAGYPRCLFETLSKDRRTNFTRNFMTRSSFQLLI